MKTSAIVALLVNCISAIKIEGVPVLVNPTLIPNDAADMDLRQRDYIIDGINGFNFVQLEDTVEGDESITLQVNGVPLLVNPESMVIKDIDSSAVRLGETIKMGPDDLKLQ